MLLRNALYFATNINESLIVEGFKDLTAAYNIDLNDENLRKSYELFSKNPNVKRIIKKELGVVNGSIEKAIAAKYASPEDFINAVNAAAQQDQASANKGKAREQMNKTISANETSDYWLIPCKTFDEAKRAAQMHKGNLPTYSFNVLKNKFGINAPEPAAYYNTDKSPAEFLEFMKTAPFFMSPSWCIAADKSYWDDYGLTPAEDGQPRCWVVISKRYPNVRFCLVASSRDKVFLKKNGRGVDIYDMKVIDEIRDPWQMGEGDEPYFDGKNMMDLAFGDADNIIHKLTGGGKRYLRSRNFDVPLANVVDFEDIQDDVVHLDENMIEFKFKSMPKLTRAVYAFSGDAIIKEFSCDMPALENGDSMFHRCLSLKRFSGNLNSLTNGYEMFFSCESLEEFSQPMPSLTEATGMFLFCNNLRSFDADISSVEFADSMFQGCKNLTHFRGNLYSVVNAEDMFKGCKLDKQSVKHIIDTIGLSDGYDAGRCLPITIGCGANEFTDEEYVDFIEIMADKGWDCVFEENS